MAKNNIKSGFELVEKIEKCAWNRGIIVNGKEAVELIKRAVNCRRKKDIDACFNCSDISICSIISELENVAQSFCLMCQIREGCPKIERFMMWFKCLF